jgi:hypothetical protein
MAYKPTHQDPSRDKTYPSEIADSRPMLAARIHCTVEDDTEEASMHGGGDQVARMNEALNAGRWKR